MVRVFLVKSGFLSIVDVVGFVVVLVVVGSELLVDSFNDEEIISIYDFWSKFYEGNTSSIKVRDRRLLKVIAFLSKPFGQKNLSMDG
ncbi:hypothetical protein BOTCAL_0832g00020 [Botryotinia calthae]|uniref:Uncharacterized protein n=1 Tax=Botryotinia calthae TaxID=38488 RepID=A0A4Y8CG21_9HELO|nr:hypothetical protein BOTCAL_0832g00020 [Botryotinia calthae]